MGTALQGEDWGKQGGAGGDPLGSREGGETFGHCALALALPRAQVGEEGTGTGCSWSPSCYLMISLCPFLAARCRGVV